MVYQNTSLENAFPSGYNEEAFKSDLSRRHLNDRPAQEGYQETMRLQSREKGVNGCNKTHLEQHCKTDRSE